jgi:hypothetical protein
MWSRKHIIDLLFFVIGLIVFYGYVSYQHDYCVVKSCTAYYPWSVDKYSAYEVAIKSQPDLKLFVNITASPFANRDTWIISSCGNCYTCTEFFENEVMHCFYYYYDISGTITKFFFLYVLFNVLMVIVLIWIFFFFRSVNYYGIQNAGMVTYCKNYYVMKLMWKMYTDEEAENIRRLDQRFKIAQKIVLLSMGVEPKLRSESFALKSAKNNIALIWKIEFPNEPTILDALLIMPQDLEEKISNVRNQLSTVWQRLR